MKKLMFLILLTTGCEDNMFIDTSRDTYHDDINDITYLNGSFFTTNYDLSANAGSQIDLIKFKYENDDSVYIDDKYDLDLNGQGYIAIDNNGLDIYLQSRESYLMIKCSAIGEHAQPTMDTIATNWQPCGVTFQNETDSIVTLYRNLDTLSQYRARTLPQDLSYLSGRDIIFNLDFVGTAFHGVYAIENKGSFYYMLGVDTAQTDILIITNNDFEVTSIEVIQDSTVLGLCFKDDDLFFSYQNRIIRKWKTY